MRISDKHPKSEIKKQMAEELSLKLDDKILLKSENMIKQLAEDHLWEDIEDLQKYIDEVEGKLSASKVDKSEHTNTLNKLNEAVNNHVESRYEEVLILIGEKEKLADKKFKILTAALILNVISIILYLTLS